MTKSEKEAFMRDGNDNESCSRRGKSRAHLRRTERERGPFITHHVHMEQPSDIHNKAPPKSELRVSGPAPTKSEDVRGQCGGAVWQIKACESSTNATY